MKNKNLMISVGLVILACVVYGVGQQSGSSDNLTKDFPKILTNEISEITIKDKGKDGLKFTYNSDLKFWMLKYKDINLISSSEKLIKVFDYVNNIKILQRVTKKEAKYKKFDLDSENSQYLIFKYKSGKIYKLGIGKSSAQGQYLKTSLSPYVYLAADNYSQTYEITQWYYKKILNYDKKMIGKIIYKTADKKNIELLYDIAKNEFNTDSKNPKSKKFKAKEAYDKDFKNLSVEEFIEISKIKGKKIASHTLVFLNNTKIQMSFFKKKLKKEKKDEYYLKLKVEESGEATPWQKYTKILTENFGFKVKAFDESSYKKKFTDFFEEIKRKKKEKPKKG